MITPDQIENVMNVVYITPQKILGGLNGERKLNDVHLVFVKLLSGTPLIGRGTKLDPLMMKIGFTDIDKEIENLSNEELMSVLHELKLFEQVIGSWTLVHDMPSTEETPQWRLSAEIHPENAQNVSLETTQEENSRRILCVDFEGVGIFMGKPKDKIKKPKN